MNSKVNAQSWKNLKLGIVGATGVVGKTFIKLLEEENILPKELRLFASEKSSGLLMKFATQSLEVKQLSATCFEGLDIVFFSSGDDISKEWGPIAAKSGCVVIDNSAAFRMENDIPLVVPEVNGDLLESIQQKKKSGVGQIIANPNCSTIQLVVALKPLLEKFGIESVHVASYQAVSGAGQKALEELQKQVSNLKLNEQNLGTTENFDLGYKKGDKENVFPHQIGFNCLPHIGSFGTNGFSSEEIKIIKETKKILRNGAIRVSAFTVRVPVMNSHAEAVWVRLNKNVAIEDVKNTLKDAKGIIVEDNLSNAHYPTQVYVNGKNPVYVGRVHQDMDDPQTIIMWVVADNVRKGAAYNGLQIANYLAELG